MSNIIKLSVFCETDQKIKIRKPQWADSINSSMKYLEDGGYMVFFCESGKSHNIEIEFCTSPRVIKDDNGYCYFAYGALIYALHHDAIELKGRTYADGFYDKMFYSDSKFKKYKYVSGREIEFKDGKIITKLLDLTSNVLEEVELKPMMYSVLRQAAF